MHNIIQEIGKNTCYGCGVCSASCPKHIISMKLNSDGFYVPEIREEQSCIECGICIDVCSYTKEDLSSQPEMKQAWAAWSNDERVRRKCSSGGVGFEIGKHLIEQGYKAVGCRYDIQEQRAEHFEASTVEQFVQSIGSKYIQSYTEEAFRQIERKGQKYIVTGTPCQIDSFRRMIRKFHCEENFILLDFFCHCVPSMWAWRSYMKMLEPSIGKVTYASWRNKFDYGWHDNWLMGVDGVKTSKPVDWNQDYDNIIQEKNTAVKSRLTQGDLFYKLFLGDVCCGPQCEKKCKYKYDKSAADIRIGDLWGKTYKDINDGVSALVAFTQRGADVVNALTNVTLIEHPFEIVAESQMKENTHGKEMYPIVMSLLRKDAPLNGKVFKTVFFSQKVINKVKKFFKK